MKFEKLPKKHSFLILTDPWLRKSSGPQWYDGNWSGCCTSRVPGTGLWVKIDGHSGKQE